MKSKIAAQSERHLSERESAAHLLNRGVDGGCTQRDVEEVARRFTGWTVNWQELTFGFQTFMHDSGEKVVLGRRIPSDYDEGVMVLKLLSLHPSTAQFIATKLVRHYVSDDPPQTLVRRTADIFDQTDGDIREMTRTIVTSKEFFDPNVYRAKAKTPIEVVGSSVRAVGAEVLVPQSVRSLVNQGMLPMSELIREKTQLQGLSTDVQAYFCLVEPMEGMGQFLYRFEAPTGYPDRGDYWMNAITVLNRMKFAVSLVESSSGRWRRNLNPY